MKFDTIDTIKYLETREQMEKYIEGFNIEEPIAVVLSNKEDNSVYCDMYKAYFIISGDNIEGSLIEGKQLIYNGSQKTA